MRSEIESCDPQQLAGLIDTETVSPASPLVEAAGTRIGRYKLLQLIGEGGFGSVFMAEQETPVVRKVALKIIKLGMDTKQVIARFEAERQALAMMDHPNIARVLDAGATDTGRPYFVMELVKGIPITEYCDRSNLSLRQRLELFIPVCKAVQHAHQKGIIHRDIKPSNVLVTLHDGTAVPKVIDFGIAKAVNQRLTEHTLFTEYRQLIGTPEYTSPEQADISGLDVDTRSDIYSLGVLLYQLLTGSTPFDSKQLRAGAYSEIQRIIREVEPPKPSTRLSTLGAGLQTLATRMAIEPKKLGRLIAGELDWIVMKCLEKDRNRRYNTADSLADDVKRHLSGDPVEASPPSALYRLRKFTRKYRLAMGVASLLVCATVISSWQAVSATRARAVAQAAQRQAGRDRDQAIAEKQRADQQADIAKAVNDFLNEDVLSQASPLHQGSDSAPNPDIKMRDALDRASARIAKRFSAQPLIEANIRGTIGQAYADLGEWDKAKLQLDAALKLARDAVGERHPATLDAMYRIADLQADLDEMKEAKPRLEQVLEGRRAALGDNHRDTLAAARRLADVYSRQRQFSKAEPMFRQTLETQRKFFGEHDRDALITLSHLGLMFFERREYDKAEPLLIESLEGTRKELSEQHPDTLEALSKVAMLRMMQEKYPDAERLLLAVVDGRRHALGELHPDTLGTSYDLSFLYSNQRQYTKAEAIIAQALNRWPKSNDFENTLLFASLQARLAELYGEDGSFDKAETLLLHCLDVGTKTGRSPENGYVGITSLLAKMYLRQKEYVKAEPLFKQLLDTQRKHYEPGDNELYFNVRSMAEVYAGERKYALAAPLFREALQIAENDVNSFFRTTKQALCSSLVLCYRRMGQTEDALEWGRKLHEMVESRLAKEIRTKTEALTTRPSDPQLLADRGHAYGALGRFEEATADYLKAMDLNPPNPDTWFHGLPLLLERGDVDGYRQRRTLALLRFKNSSRVAAHISKICLLLPLEGEELTLAAKLARRGVYFDPANLWNQQGLGMAEYRLGHYEQAITWLLKASDSPNHLCQADSQMYLALCYARQGRRELAVAALRRGMALMDYDLPQPGEGDLNDFQDWILCHLARREAEALIGHVSPTTEPTSPPIASTRPGVQDLAAIRRLIGDEIGDMSEEIRRKIDAPDAGQLHHIRGDLYARLGSFQDAASDYGKAIDMQPDEFVPWHEGVPLLLQVGDVEGYHRRHGEELRRFANTEDANAAFLVARDSLMLPIEGEELKIVAALAERVGTGRKDLQMTKGMAEYRLGHYEQCIPWLSKGADNTYFGVDAEFFTAMACWRLGKAIDARDALARAIWMMEAKLPKPGELLQQGGVNLAQDWVLSQFLRREAEALINGSAAVPTTTPVSGQPAAGERARQYN